MTRSILNIIHRGQRRQHVRHDLALQPDDDNSADDILELKAEDIVIEPEPNQLRADKFHLVMTWHVKLHNKVRYRQLTSGAT